MQQPTDNPSPDTADATESLGRSQVNGDVAESVTNTHEKESSVEQMVPLDDDEEVEEPIATVSEPSSSTHTVPVKSIQPETDIQPSTSPQTVTTVTEKDDTQIEFVHRHQLQADDMSPVEERMTGPEQPQHSEEPVSDKDDWGFDGTTGTVDDNDQSAFSDGDWGDGDGFACNSATDFAFDDNSFGDFSESTATDTPQSQPTDTHETEEMVNARLTMERLRECGFLTTDPINDATKTKHVHDVITQEIADIIGSSPDPNSEILEVTKMDSDPNFSLSRAVCPSDSISLGVKVAESNNVFNSLLDMDARETKEDTRLRLDRSRRAFHLRMMYMSVGGTESPNARYTLPAEDSTEGILSSLVRVELMAERHKGIQSKFDEMVKRRKQSEILKEDAVAFMKQMERMDEVLKEEERALEEQNRIIAAETEERQAHPELGSSNSLDTNVKAVLEDTFTKKMKKDGGLLVVNNSVEQIVAYSQLPDHVGVKDLFNTMRKARPPPPRSNKGTPARTQIGSLNEESVSDTNTTSQISQPDPNKASHLTTQSQSQSQLVDAHNPPTPTNAIGHMGTVEVSLQPPTPRHEDEG